MSFGSPEELQATLAQLLQPDSNAIKQAEARLRQFTNQPDSVPGFLQQVVEAQDPAIRQLAAVLLRRRVGTHWLQLSDEDRAFVRDALETRLSHEETWLVCKAVAGVVAAIAKVAVPRNEWPNLLELLYHLAASNVESHRRAALTLFTSFLEHLGNHFSPHASSLASVFHTALQDPSPAVRGAALHALGSFVPWLEGDNPEHVTLFRGLLEPLTKFVQETATHHGAEDLVVRGLEVLDEFLEMPEEQLGDTATHLLRFLLGLLATRDNSPAVRQAALFSVQLVVQDRPKLVVQQGMVSELVHLATELFREGDLDMRGGGGGCGNDDGNHYNNNNEEDNDNDNDDEEESTYSPVYMGNVLLDDLALVLPSRYVYPEVAAYAQKHVHAADPTLRRASLLALGVSAEGCAERMSGDVKDVVGLMVGGLQDGEPVVREAACVGLLQAAQHLQPGVSTLHAQVMPALFAALEDNHRRVVERALATLDAYCESLSDSIEPYLSHLLQRLLALLHTAPLHLQEVIMSTLSSVASAASHAILPYMEELLGLCQQILATDSPETLSLRARTIEGVGLIGLAVGYSHFEPYIDTFMNAALRPFADQTEAPPEIGEYTFGFFANMAQTAGGAFERYLTTVVPILNQAAEAEDIVDVSNGGMDGAVSLAEVQARDEDADEGEGDEELDFDAELNLLTGGDASLRVRTAALQEKSSAVYALGVIAGETGAAFLPHASETLTILTRHAMHFHDEVRQNIMISLRALISCLLRAQASEEMLRNTVRDAMKVFTHTLTHDGDKAAVARASEGVTFVCKNFGRVGLGEFETDVLKAVRSVLQQEAPCQRYQDADEEEADHDFVAMDSVSECLDNVAVVLGTDFEPYFRDFLPLLLRYTHPQRTANDHLMAIGTFAEVGKALGGGFAVYSEVLWPVFVRALNSDNQMLLRNSVYALGILFRNGGTKMQPHIQHALQLLFPRFNVEHNDPETTDNAASAVCSMLMSHTASMPVNDVLPVLLSVLPIRADFLEAPNVYECMVWLLRQGHAADHVGEVLRVLGGALCQDGVSDDLKRHIATTIAELRQAQPDVFAQVMQSLPEDISKTLSTV